MTWTLSALVGAVKRVRRFSMPDGESYDAATVGSPG